jgi:hypothetical protein
MGRQKQLQRTTWISTDKFWNQICPTFVFSKNIVSNFFGLIWKGAH